MNYKCLIIDDEKLLADSTAEYFNLFGVQTAVAYSAAECRAFFETDMAQLLLLDINLGDGSGFALCRELRERTQIPILFISARTSDDDQIMALHIGGDDYIQKPYSLGVLLAKVKAVLKRYGERTESAASYAGAGSPQAAGYQTGAQAAGYQTGAQAAGWPGAGGSPQMGGYQAGYADDWLCVRVPAREVTAGGKHVRLTPLEFKLLCCLIKNRERVVSKQELFEQVWENRFTGDGTLNVHIRKLREAIERDPGRPEYILTVWGDGYRFCGGMR